MASLLSSLSQDASPQSGGTGALAEKQNILNEYAKANSSNQPAAALPAKAASQGSSPKDRVKPDGKYGDRGAEKRIDVSKMVKPLGSYKKGGKVKKTGIYKLHSKERVLNAKQTEKLEGLAKGLSK